MHRSYLRRGSRRCARPASTSTDWRISPAAGSPENAPRIVAGGATALFERDWPAPPIFALIQRTGGISDADMLHAFNMGLGMCLVLPAAQADQARAALPTLFPAGHIVARTSAPVEIQ